MDIVTDYGVVKLGKKFLAEWDECELVMAQKSKRSKAYKEAKRWRGEIERAVMVYAKVHFSQNGDMRTTP